MTSKRQIPSIFEEKNKMSKFSELVSKKMTKDYNFMGTTIKISKLSVRQVKEIQEKSKGLSEDSEEGFDLVKDIIRGSVEGADEISSEDFDNFPLGELNKLSEEIMKFSGLGDNKGK